MKFPLFRTPAHAPLPRVCVPNLTLALRSPHLLLQPYINSLFSRLSILLLPLFPSLSLSSLQHYNIQQICSSSSSTSLSRPNKPKEEIFIKSTWFQDRFIDSKDRIFHQWRLNQVGQRILSFQFAQSLLLSVFEVLDFLQLPIRLIFRVFFFFFNLDSEMDFMDLSPSDWFWTFWWLEFIFSPSEKSDFGGDLVVEPCDRLLISCSFEDALMLCCFWLFSMERFSWNWCCYWRFFSCLMINCLQLTIRLKLFARMYCWIPPSLLLKTHLDVLENMVQCKWFSSFLMFRSEGNFRDLIFATATVFVFSCFKYLFVIGAVLCLHR